MKQNSRQAPMTAKELIERQCSVEVDVRPPAKPGLADCAPERTLVKRCAASASLIEADGVPYSAELPDRDKPRQRPQDARQHGASTPAVAQDVEDHRSLRGRRLAIPPIGPVRTPHRKPLSLA